MSLARLVVTAVRVQGRSKSEVARDYRLSRRWVQELGQALRRRGRVGPDAAVPPAPEQPPTDPGEPRRGDLRAAQASRRPGLGRRRPDHCLPPDPAPATIWRILTQRGFVTPQPHKRPRSSFVRFEAQIPNERWQADLTHWKLAAGVEVDIQHPPAASGAGPTHPRGRVRRPAQGHSRTTRAGRSPARPRPPRHGRPHRGHHPAPQQPALSHPPGPPPRRGPRAGPGRRLRRSEDTGNSTVMAPVGSAICSRTSGRWNQTTIRFCLGRV
jgi:hypothetical protein